MADTCPRCSAARVPNTRFCPQCGMVLAADTQADETPLPATSPSLHTPSGAGGPGSTPVPPGDWRKETLVARADTGGTPTEPSRDPRGSSPGTRPGAAGAEDSPVSREFAPDTVIDGRYRVLSVLGTGGMGSVYRVRHERMHKVMALKVVRSQLSRDPSVRARFHREAHALSSLESRHTVAVFDFGETPEGQLYLAMEHLRGRTLAAALREGPLSPRRTVHVLAQVLRSLQEAHEKGIVHRDIKPDNIFLVDGEEKDFAKLIDFGIAKADKAMAPRDGGQPLTQDDLLVGTPEYMSPEQARGMPVDVRTDIWAIGVVLCECLTGKRPFQGETPIDVIMSILQDPLPQPWELAPSAEVPSAVWSVGQRALQKEAGQRFDSAATMREAMEHAAEQDGVSATATPAPLPGAARPAPLIEASDDDSFDDGGQLAGRDEWSRFLVAQRRRRTFAALVSACVLGGAVAYVAPSLLEDASAPAVTEEREPNNDALHATAIRADSSVSGVLAVPVQGQADKDLFAVDLPPGPRFLDAQVETRGPMKVNLGLSAWVDGHLLFDGWGNRLPVSRVQRVLVEGKRLTLMVREENATSDVPPSPVEVPYRLTVEALRPVTADEDREPNDRRETATVLTEGARLQAGIHPADDEDQFRIHLPADEAEHRLEVTPSEGLALEVQLVGPEGRQVLRRAGKDGEKLSLPLSTRRCGSPCTAVVTADRGVPADAAYTLSWK
ncbi:MAG: protein kinase [Deltaproteobacteria bacterium]|nr:protein kinase [Deltaproteobacteria bacterium]